MWKGAGIEISCQKRNTNVNVANVPIGNPHNTASGRGIQMSGSGTRQNPRIRTAKTGKKANV